MQAEPRAIEPTAAERYSAVRQEIMPHVQALAKRRSTAELLADPVYQAIAPVVEKTLGTAHVSDFRREVARAQRRYRIVAWNIERGTHITGQLEALCARPYLREADVLLITEADAGMARSGNRMVAEILARELGMFQVFAPCYIALGKGSGVERDVDGGNEFGLHGNALLSRYPIRDVRLIPLPNGMEKIAHREQRLGRQVAIASVVDFPNTPVELVCVHLDANSSHRHRCR